MSRKPYMVRCQGTTKAGQPCSSWAMRGSTLCRHHRTDLAPTRPPEASQNRQTHGLYARFSTAGDVVDVAVVGTTMTLDDEIACTRVVIRRLSSLVGEAESIAESCRLANTIFAGTGRVAQLLRAQRELSAEGANTVASVVAGALDALGTEWGLSL